MSTQNAAEIWKPCPRFNRYEVSSLGRFRLVSNGNIVKKYTATKSGRQFVRLKPDQSIYKKRPTPRRLPCGRISYGKVVVKTAFTAPLICEAFHGPRPDGMQVDHCNGKLDERASQLEWVTHSENVTRAYERGDQPSQRRFGGLTDDQHAEIKALYRQGLSQVKISQLFKCSNSTVSRIVNNKIKTARFA